jgi:hypothetical protein
VVWEGAGRGSLLGLVPSVFSMMTPLSESCFFFCLGRIRQASPSEAFSSGSSRADALLLSCARSVEQ